MRNAWIWIVVVVILIGGALLWWQNSQPTGVSNTTPTVNGTDLTPVPGASEPTAPTSSATSTTQSSVKEFTVTNKGYVFSPKTLTVNKGDTVKITFTNGGGTHNLMIDGYDVGTKTIQGGQSDSFEFVADKAGTFEFYCSVGNHRAMGMVGTFTVNP